MVSVFLFSVALYSFPIAVETFRMMGEIIALYMELKENIKDLDEEQAGQTDLEKIQYLLALMGGCCMHRGETIVLLLKPRPRGCSGLGEPRPALPSF